MRILDLYCGEGGAGEGYRQAGFDVVGVDVERRRYPAGAFLWGNALALNPHWIRKRFDAVHASPPCQAHVQLSVKHRGKGTLADERPELIAPTRELLERAGLPFVIENVVGAKNALRNPVQLTGGQFGLGVHRPRLFECSGFAFRPPERAPKPKNPVAVYGKMDGRLLWRRKDGTELRAPRSVEEARTAMGISWMGWEALTESIPPAYTRCIGEQLMAALGNGACPST